MFSDTNPYYNYFVPSLAAAVLALIYFSIATPAHLYRMITTRKYFGVPLVLGGIFEMTGFAARVYTHFQLNNEAAFIVQIVGILLAPILFAAGIYMFLGRLISATGYPNFSLVRVRFMTKIFVAGDILCFLVQAFGATKLVNTTSITAIHEGQNIIVCGLLLQFVIFGFFVAVAGVFDRRVTRSGMAATVPQGVQLRLMLRTVYITSALIMVRSIYRFIDYINKHGGYLQSHEWPAYVLDVIPMAGVVAITMLWYGCDFTAGMRTGQTGDAVELKQGV
ncbi:hypothetical protein ANO11243_094680 [Dothideomycetidae sp. 11243]|nr:hypothetical protein ANO11243_094680 [fungal sp. No.11243]